MSRYHANDPRQDDEILSPGFTRLLAVAFGTAMLLGLVSGLVWIAWNLVRLRLL